jgi:uncharacterized transporter YbjL
VICGLEIAMLVWGIIIMVTGKMKVSANREVRGMAARGLAVFLILPFPLAFGLGVLIGLLAPDMIQNNRLALSGIEAVIVLGCAAVAIVVGIVIGKPPGPSPMQGFPVESQDQPPQGPA